MGEESFHKALFHIMWKMEIDIFSEKEKTLALLSDIVPKCKKQRMRIKAMYECGAMDFIEKAVADSGNYKKNLNKAVKLLKTKIGLSEEKAVAAVNGIIALWQGDLPKLELSDINKASDSGDINNTKENKDGDEEMIFLQDTAVEENTDTQEEEQGQEQEAEQTEEPGGEASAPHEPILGKIIDFWCKSDFEDGRPLMVACPIGWFLILVSCVLGAFMVYDIPIGDKFVVPTFPFMFSVLTSKRLYRYGSTGRFSLLIGAFYITAMLKALWIGHRDVSFVCIPIVIAALIVFNSGRIGSWFDESKRSSFTAYFVYIFLSAAITVGVFAVQNMTF